MRVKQLWSVIPAPAKLRFLWDRITLSRTTSLYFAFSVLHCILQLVLQIRAFVINAEAANTLYQITLQGNATNDGFAVLGSDLRICSTIPHNLSAASCPVYWDGTPGTENAWNSPSSALDHPSSSSLGFSDGASTASSPSATGVLRAPSLSVTASAPPPLVTLASHEAESNGDHLHKRYGLGGVNINSFQVDGTTVVTVNGPGFSKPATLERSCIFALNYPVAVLQDTKREDIVFVAFQLWVLGMSIVALIHESIPHIITSLLTHVLATAWAAFQIVHTASFRRDFIRLTINGACKPINLLPSYWRRRRGAEIPILALNIVALFVSAFLTWKLVKLFGWQTFKRVGASLTMHRIYKTVLVLSIILQLALFSTIVLTALWIDQLSNGSIARLAKKAELYKALFTITLILLVPWFVTGWVAIRRELKIPMLIFLVMSIVYLTGLGFMFVSDAFRWTFLEWRFFSLIALAAAVLTALSFILGIVCRINFNKGLPHYLNAESPLPGDDFEPVSPSDVEKFDFPSDKEVIPSPPEIFNAAPYGSHMVVNNEPHETKQANLMVTVPPKAHVKSSSLDSSLSHDELGNNSDDENTQHRRNMSLTKRWVIE